MPNRVSELYYEELGADFDRFMSDYDVARRVELMRRMMPADHGPRVLEVGCGTGAVTRGLDVSPEGLEVTDISATLAQTVGEERGCAWSQQDACRLSFESDSFDLVYSSECVEHTPSPEAALREMARVTAPGGWVLITTPNRLWYPVLWLAMRLHIRKYQGNEVWLWPRRAAHVLEDAGMRIERISGCHLWPWHIPLAKRVLPGLDRFGDQLYPAMINFAIVAQKSR